MNIADFKNIHAGENILCLGTGTSLLNTPVEFLRSMPSIGINYLPYYNDLLDGFTSTYWMALDTGPTMVFNLIPETVPRFVPTRQHSRIAAAGRSLNSVVFFEMNSMPRPVGSGYSTTMAGAVQLALYMGAKNVLIDGFDCTKGHQSGSRARPGMTGTPHFYDPECGRKYAQQWDKNVSEFAVWAKKRGQNVWNISKPTMSKLLDRSGYEEWLDRS